MISYTEEDVRSAWRQRIAFRLHSIGRNGDSGSRLTPAQVDCAANEMMICLEDLELFTYG